MPDPTQGMHRLFLREEELGEALALLAAARRVLDGAVDAALAGRELGRAHHRALFRIARQPGLSSSALQGVLGVSKQSLARITADLDRAGLIARSPGRTDRRARLLELTEAGKALERSITGRQRALVATAYRSAGGAAVEGFRRVLGELARLSGPEPAPRPPGAPR